MDLPSLFAFDGQKEEEQCYRQIDRNEANGLHKNGEPMILIKHHLRKGEVKKGTRYDKDRRYHEKNDQKAFIVPNSIHFTDHGSFLIQNGILSMFMFACYLIII